MVELLFMGGLLAFAVPLAFLAAMAYVFFWLLSVVLKTAGVMVGGAVAIAVCAVAVVGAVLFVIAGLPFLLFFAH